MRSTSTTQAMLFDSIKRPRGKRPSLTVWIAMLVLLFGAGLSRADVTDIIIDSANISSYNSTAASSFSWSHTVSASLTNRYLVVCFSLTGNTTSTPTGIQVSAVSYGGNAMTRRVSQNSGSTQGRTEIWDLLAPPTGSNSVSVVLSTTTQVVASAVGFGNVNQTSPSRASASTAPPTASSSISLAVTSALRDAIIDVVSLTYPITPTQSTPQTRRWNINVGTNTTDLRGAGSTKAGVSAFDGMAWSLSASTLWSISAESIAPPNTPSLAKFVTLKALDTSRGTLLRWRTGYEVENLGFRIYRESGDERVPVNQRLIAGSALFRGPTKELRSGRSYSFFDQNAPRAGFSTYWLEDVALDGTSSFHGPYASQPMAPTEEAKFFAEMKAGGILSPSLSDLKSAATTPQGRVSAIPRSKVAKLGPWVPAGQAAAKISISQEGYYRVTRAQLSAAGFDPGPDATNLQLLAQGEEVAISLSGTGDGYFDMDDAVEFYGRGLDTPSTASQVYWLIQGDQPGQRITTFRRYPKREGGERLSDQFYIETVQRKDRTLYVAALTSNGDRDNFYGGVVNSTPLELSLDADRVANPNAPGNPASLKLAVQGITAGEHQVRVEFNGHDLGLLSMSDEEQGIFQSDVDASWLVEGSNILKLTAIVGDSDVSVFDEASLSFDRPFFAIDDELAATAAPGAIVRLRGFSNRAIEILDVSNELQPRRLMGRPFGNSGIACVTPPSTGSKTSQVMLYAFAANAIRQPDAISANIPSDWGSPNHSADLVIITPRQFEAQAETLAAHRRSQDLDVEVISVADLDDEFAYGEKNPAAIRDFLGYAGDSWAKAPSYVLLFGDASFDPRNYLGFGDFDFVPTHIQPVLDLKTADDDWFADFNLDDRPEMAIGRLPVRTAAEASTVVSKIIAYDAAPDTGGWTQQLSLIAGVGDDYSFESAVDDLMPLIPAGMTADEMSVEQMGADAARQGVMDAFNEGRLIINYNGHGSQTIWNSGLLDSDDVATMTNEERLPVVISMNCLNGLFHDVYQESLAETLLKAPNGGAVAVWASSALTDPAGQAKLNEALYQRIFDGSHPALGDAILDAKSGITDSYVRSSWIFFGDPSMKLK